MLQDFGDDFGLCAGYSRDDSHHTPAGACFKVLEKGKANEVRPGDSSMSSQGIARFSRFTWLYFFGQRLGERL